MQRRRPEPFERAIRDAKVFDDEDGNRGIFIPDPHATHWSNLPHARPVRGGVIYGLDQETLATVVADTLAALADGGEQTETFRHRLLILRRLCGPEMWEEAEQAFELARSIAAPGSQQ